MTEFAWMIEAPGPRYLEACEAIGHVFRWTKDPNDGLRFCSYEQADNTMMALREIVAPLFGFEITLGHAVPVQHGFISSAPADDVSTPPGPQEPPRPPKHTMVA